MTKSIILVAMSLIASCSLVSCGSSSASETKVPSPKKVEPVVEKPVVKTWTKDSTENDMGEKTIYYNVESNDLVYLDFPYNGGSTGNIVVRKKKGKLGLLFTIDKGQIDTDYDGTYIRVKFDDEEPITWSMGEAADGSSDVLFFNNESKFYNKLKKSSKVVLEIPFYQNGKKQFTFNTAGLPM